MLIGELVVANEVYANGREIASKSGDGKTIAAFPDVCFTPPENPATPPGVPVPYPNNGYDADTAEGSKTVNISGKEIMLRDQSFFKKSEADDAGKTAKKGIITSVIDGKVFFNSWSMDVKVEGENVDRHLDITTNNHASKPGNTPPSPHKKKGSASTNSSEECIHEWSFEKAEKAYTADQKKERLRKSSQTGDAFEATAADHNKINDGEDMSGPNKQSKLHAKCKKCGKMTEIDHVTREENGKLDSIVECKSGNSGVKGPQALERIEIAKQLGCKAKYKLQAGDGADKAERFLLDKGWDPSNIIKV